MLAGPAVHLRIHASEPREERSVFGVRGTRRGPVHRTVGPFRVRRATRRTQIVSQWASHRTRRHELMDRLNDDQLSIFETSESRGRFRMMPNWAYETHALSAVNAFLFLWLPRPHGPLRQARALDRVLADGPDQRHDHGDEPPRPEDSLPCHWRAGLSDAGPHRRRGEEGSRCGLHEVHACGG